MNQIKKYLDWLDNNRNLALGLVSDPGMGKTSMVNQWAEEHGRDVFSLVVSQRSPTEVSGMAMPDNDTQKMCVYDFDSLLNLKDGDILFLDEFGNGNPMTINATLTVILDRKLPSGRKLNDIIVVAACNPQGCTMFTPQVKQRFIWKEVFFESYEWISYIKQHHTMVSTKLLERISMDIKCEKFDKKDWNYMTPRSAENLIQLYESSHWSNAFLSDYKASESYRKTIKTLDTFNDSLNTKLMWDIVNNAPQFVDSEFFREVREVLNDRELYKICTLASEGEWGRELADWVNTSHHTEDVEKQQPKTNDNMVYEEVVYE